jgi:hypothetical protein
VGIGAGTQAKHGFRAGDILMGQSQPVADPWKPRDDVRYRFETFCYGPKSCRLHRPGPRRKVPGRKGVTYEEPDWVDKDATEHRGRDE